MKTLLALLSLTRRELVHFLRQPSRVVGAAATPLVFWLFFGSGFSGSFRLPGGSSEVDYLEYFFPGTVALLVLFAAIFSTMSVIDDRHAGFLQGVLAAPVPRWAMVAGKVLGGSILGWGQGVVFLALAPLAGIRPGLGGLALATAILALMALGMTALGFAFAWQVDSTQGFHAVMNLLLIPMWLLSGALFPAAGAPGWLRAVMTANPLTYGVDALRHALSPASVTGAGLGPCLGVLGGFAAACLVADVIVVRSRPGRA